MTKRINSKVYSLRTREDLYNDFQKAVYDLPIKISPTKYIESYMEYIVKMANDYRSGKPIRLGFVSNKENIIFFDMQDKQTFIEFEE